MCRRGRIPSQFQAAADRDLGLRRAVPERPALFFDLVADRVGEEAAQLAQQVEAGAVDDEVVALGPRSLRGALELEHRPLAVAGERDVDGAAGDEGEVVVVGDPGEARSGRRRRGRSA